MKLRYERGALTDLDEIFAYIAADNREAAGRLLSRIEYAAGRIAALLVAMEAWLSCISARAMTMSACNSARATRSFDASANRNCSAPVSQTTLAGSP